MNDRFFRKCPRLAEPEESTDLICLKGSRYDRILLDALVTREMNRLHDRLERDIASEERIRVALTHQQSEDRIFGNGLEHK